MTPASQLEADVARAMFEASSDRFMRSEQCLPATRAAIAIVVEACAETSVHTDLFSGDRLIDSDPRQTIATAIRTLTGAAS